MDTEASRWKVLRATIEDTYKVFRSYRLSGAIRCEMSDQVLVPDGVPLRQRVAADFQRYEGKAMTTLGTVADYKHFLPRLIELNTEHHRRQTLLRNTISCDELLSSGISLDMIAMKLDYAQASSWPAAERDVLAAFGVARWWWELTLPTNYHGGVRDAMAVLDAVGHPLHEQLPAMFDSATDTDLLLLSRFVNRSITSSAKRPVPHFDWARRDADAEDPLTQWLLTAEVAAALEAAFFRETDPTAAEELSNSVRHLGWLRST